MLDSVGIKKLIIAHRVVFTSNNGNALTILLSMLIYLPYLLLDSLRRNLFSRDTKTVCFSVS